MALFKILNNFTSGTSIENVTNYVQGYCYFDKNTGRFWIDTTNDASGRVSINGNFYTVCSTAANVATKEVSCPGFILTTGAAIYVRFDRTNTADISQLKLKVNNNAAINIKYRNDTINEASDLSQNSVYCFVYDGTNF